MRFERKWFEAARSRNAGLVVLCVLSLVAALAGAHASHIDIRGGDGGDLPDPLAASNQYYELKAGELYMLSGWIVFAPAVTGNSRKLLPHLLVDLKAHPGLGSRHTREAPMYPLADNPASWRVYEGLGVKLAGTAESRVVFTQETLQHVLMFDPMPELSVLPGKPE